MPRCRAASLIDPVSRIASGTAILPGPMRSPLARSRRMQRRVFVTVPNLTLDNAFGERFPRSLMARASSTSSPTAWEREGAPLPIIRSVDKRRPDATAKHNAGDNVARTATCTSVADEVMNEGSLLQCSYVS
jgi:hypothetical protein